MQKFTLPLFVSSLYLAPLCAQEQQDLGAPVFGPKSEGAGPSFPAFGKTVTGPNGLAPF
jgi:hypothetical protein